MRVLFRSGRTPRSERGRSRFESWVAMLPGYGIGIRALSLTQVIAGSTPALAICPGRPAAEDAAFSARRSWVRIPLGVSSSGSRAAEQPAVNPAVRRFESFPERADR